MSFFQDSIFLDDDFLDKICAQQEREVYARIIAFDINEIPIDQIEGKVTTGSINIDGNSAVRRTCSLTMIKEDIDINEYYWGIKTKFKLEIGLKNKINKDYPDIIWFSQGYYVISSFNTSLSINNCTISLQGKDKMCLLNGDLGGQLYASIDFGTEEEKILKAEEILFSENPKDSRFLMQNKYYVKLTSEDEDNEIYSNNDFYFFIKNKDNGLFNKNNGLECFTKKEENENGQYDGYKLVQNPKALFEKIYFFSDNSFYAYTGSNSRTLIDSYSNLMTIPVIYTSNDPSDNNTISKENIIKNYEKNKYYYNSINEDFFSLDTTINFTEGRQYYKLKPLYEKVEEVKKEKIPLSKIIRESVHTYANEPYHNIIINDLDDHGLEQLTYKGDVPLYILYDTEKKESKQISFNIETFKLPNQGDNIIFATLSPFSINTNEASLINNTDCIIKVNYGDDIGYRLTDLVYTGDLITNIGDSLVTMLDKIKQMLGEFEYFYDIDGRFIFQKKKDYLQTSWTPIVYSKEENNNESYIDLNNSKFSFNFLGNKLFSTIQNSPVLNNVKNDITVWGKRKSSSGEEVPIHARYAIDKKPVYYKALGGKIYLTSLSLVPQTFFFSSNFIQYPWINFKKLMNFLQIESNEYNSIIENIYSSKKGINIEILQDFFGEGFFIDEDDDNVDNICFISIDSLNSDNYFFEEQYKDDLIDLISDETDVEFYVYIYSIPFFNLVDWREIIYQMALDYFKGQGCSNDNPVFLSGVTSKDDYLKDPDQFLYEVGKRNPEYYPTGYTGYEQYYTDMQGFWRQLYNPQYEPHFTYSEGKYQGKNWIEPKITDYITEYYIEESLENKFKDQININTVDSTSQQLVDQINNKIDKYITEDKNKKYWNVLVFEAPETLNFWFDFLDSNNFELQQFSVPQLGPRSKVINEDKAKVIIYKDVPNFILYTNQADLEKGTKFLGGYDFINIPEDYSQYFTISYRGLSAKEKIDTLLYQHSYCIENITLNSVPIYHLEPNTRINVYDDKTNINGEYIVNRITIPLMYNGTMSITANKAPERIY